MRAVLTGIAYEGFNAVVSGTGQQLQTPASGLASSRAAVSRASWRASRRAAGRHHAVLTASPDGLGVYRRLGFVPVATVRRFLLRAQ